MNVNLRKKMGKKQAVIMVIVLIAFLTTGTGYRNTAAAESSPALTDAGTWTLKSSYAKAFTDYAWSYSKLRNKLYYFGGKELSEGGTAATKETTSYDPATNQFRKLGNIPYDSERAIAAEVGYNNIYVAAGGLLYRFDVENERWVTQGASDWKYMELPQGINVSSMASSGELLYVFGQVQGTNKRAVYECNPSASKFEWIRKTDMPEEKQNFSAIGYEGKFYIYGGESETGVKSNTMYEYDPRSDKGYGTDSEKAWTGLERANFAKSSYTWTIKYGTIYIINGNNTNTVEAYSIKADQWVQMPSTKNKSNMAAFSPVKLDQYVYMGYIPTDNKIYTLGYNQVEAFEFSDDHPNSLFDTGSSLPLGISKTGKISYPGDVDIFSYGSAYFHGNVGIKITAVNQKTGEPETLKATLYSGSRYDMFPRCMGEYLFSPDSGVWIHPMGYDISFDLVVSHPNNGADGYSYTVELIPGG